MESKAQQIGLIGNILDQVNGLDTETKDRIDLEAEIDPELSVSENWEELKDKYGIRPEGELMEEAKEGNHRKMSDEEYYEEEKRTLASEHRIDPKDIEKFREMIDSDEYDALNRWSRKINPFIKGMDRARKACLLTLTSSQGKGPKRGRIHTLLVGPPGTGKTDIRNWIKHRLGAIGAGPRSSEVGLKYDARGEGTPGALAQAHKGVLVLDELEKFKKAQRASLLESMEEGTYEVTVGDKRKTIPAEVRVIACCNSTDPLEDALLDRFDFIVKVEVPSREKEKEITDHIYDTWFDVGGLDAGKTLQSYLKWVRPYEPEVSGEVMEKVKEMKNTYIDLSEKEADIREKESLLRTAICLAKINRRDVRPEDYLKAIKLQNPDLNSSFEKALSASGLA